MSRLPGLRLSKDESRHVRGLYESWKRDAGIGPGSPVSANPVARAAFRRVLVDHSYGYRDLAEWLGLSRERVRVVANEMGIDAPGVDMRIWDDEAGCFVSVSAVEYYARCAEARREAAVLPRGEVWAKRRKVAVWVLRDLRDDLGRIPCRTDLADAFAMQSNRVGPSWLGLDARGLNQLWAEAGLPERPKHYAGRPDMEAA